MGKALIQSRIERSRIEPTSSAVPTRIIVRAACDFLLAGLAEGTRTYGSLRRAVFMTAISVANVQHITRSAVRTWRHAGLEQIPPDNERRPVSILSLSQSLRTPFETTRAHVNALLRDGLCVRTPSGVVVPSDVLLVEAVVRSEDKLWRAFWEMIEALRSLGFDFSMVRGDAPEPGGSSAERDFSDPGCAPSPRWLILRILSEFYLNAIVEATAPHDDDWIISTVSSAFMSLNSAAFSHSAPEAWQYSKADTPPPDHLRVPASIADVAKLTGLGRELVRRKANELVSAGRLDRTAEGFLVNMDYMQGPESRAGGGAIVTAFYRMIYDLTALGVRL